MNFLHGLKNKIKATHIHGYIAGNGSANDVRQRSMDGGALFPALYLF